MQPTCVSIQRPRSSHKTSRSRALFKPCPNSHFAASAEATETESEPYPLKPKEIVLSLRTLEISGFNRTWHQL
ncbi:hypothetical protein CKAN_00071300 [Cinnamomum micranthum f. kanehirae]|uniref:Uncharacterized protein n=1 Tax=Cinnamomum micranthum f. kanehirae TaxID=337451 RepID=A0A3S3MES5_9MAGN|nr:hypothetical protein CKAN_00071300 [Cinnamomum micranthum f. kanehirae]